MDDTEKGRVERGRWWPLVLALVLLGAVLYFPRLGAGSLWDPWEPKYAQASREMADSGQWVVPSYRHDARLNKPPVTYWLIAASQTVLGVHEIAARLPSALLAIGGALALGLAFRARGRPLEGFLAGGALLTSPQWLLLGRFATPDIPLASLLGTALALAIAYPVVRDTRRRRWMLAAIAVLVAAAGLTDWTRGLLLPAWAVLGWGAMRWSWKGPLALTVVAVLYNRAQFSYSANLNLAAALLAIALAVLVLRVRVKLSFPVIAAGLVLIAVLVTPWFLLAWDRAPDSMSVFKYKHMFNLGEAKKLHRADAWEVIRLAAIGGMPWSALALAGMLAAFRRSRDALATLLLGTFLGGALFFALSEAKMGHFYGVLQPAAAGLAAIGAVALVRKPDWRALPFAGALIVIWAAVWKDPSSLLDPATVKSSLFGIELSWLVVSVVVAWILAMAAALIARRETWLVGALLPPALLVGVLGMHVVPALEKKKSLGPAWEAYLRERAEGELLGFYGPTKDSIFYYSDNFVDRLGDKEEVDSFLSGPRNKYVIVTPASLETAARGNAGRWENVYREHPTHQLLRYIPRPEPLGP